MADGVEGIEPTDVFPAIAGGIQPNDAGRTAPVDCAFRPDIEGFAANLELPGFAAVLSVLTYWCIENPVWHATLLNGTPLIGIATGTSLISACLGTIARDV